MCIKPLFTLQYCTLSSFPSLGRREMNSSVCQSNWWRPRVGKMGLSLRLGEPMLCLVLWFSPKYRIRRHHWSELGHVILDHSCLSEHRILQKHGSGAVHLILTHGLHLWWRGFSLELLADFLCLSRKQPLSEWMYAIVGYSMPAFVWAFSNCVHFQ